MNQDYYKDAIDQKARELGIASSLLSAMLASLLQDTKATEQDFLKNYYLNMVQEQRKLAFARCESANLHEKEYGTRALRPVDASLRSIMELEEFGPARISLLLEEGEPVLQIHYRIWDQLTSELFAIKKRHGSGNGSNDAVQLVLLLCADLVDTIQTASHW